MAWGGRWAGVRDFADEAFALLAMSRAPHVTRKRISGKSPNVGGQHCREKRAGIHKNGSEVLKQNQ
jgi:hypothetical protein